jgi:hypothetical protein
MQKIAILMLIALLISACNIEPLSIITDEGMSVVDGLDGDVELEIISFLNPGITRRNVRVEDHEEYYFSQIVTYDGIRPVYKPIFEPAMNVHEQLQIDELVIGVAWGGEAKAYPITVLIYREMVNDELAGIPTLVTW